ncbi:hypothetical protein HanRHA438_Chr09g0387691 [Helianthus annuus]|nr:hypothetical protein HanIR_Chr09g0405341 [Helianthus annuus]KAJ0887169.1 hypothetical protein HanRHA438_Chr09g0387691 [Helianthus annuus]
MSRSYGISTTINRKAFILHSCSFPFSHLTNSKWRLPSFGGHLPEFSSSFF